MQATFYLSTKYLQQVLLSSGKELPSSPTASIPLEEISPDARQALLLANPRVSTMFTFRLPGDAPWYAPLLPQNAEEWDQFLLAYQQDYQERQEVVRREKQASLNRLIDEMEQMLAQQKPGSSVAQRVASYRKDALEPEQMERAEALLAQVLALQEVKQAEYEQRQREEKEQAERHAREAQDEKVRWVTEHGPAQLRAKVLSGYPCQEEYVEQRAAIEHPGFLPDFKEKASWQQRKNPSDAAFALAQQSGGLVVWLTAPPSEDEETLHYFEKGEAVIILKYLDTCHLVHVM